MGPVRWSGLTAMALALLAGGVVSADVVHLTSGGKLEGKVTETATGYAVQLESGLVQIKKDQVASIEKKASALELYEQKLAELKQAKKLEDADAQADLASWCTKNGLKAKAKEHYEKTLSLNPNHSAARQALGFQLFNGAWMTEVQVKEAQGMVKYKGQWMSKEQADRWAREDSEEKRVQNISKQLSAAVKLIAAKDPKVRAIGVEKFIQIAKLNQLQGGEKMAGDLAGYYSNAWAQQTAEIDARRATVENRLTDAQLTAPITTGILTLLGVTGGDVGAQLPHVATIETPQMQLRQFKGTSSVPSN